MKILLGKIKDFFVSVYTEVLQPDKESFAPFVAMTSIAVYFAVVILFTPWTSSTFTKHGVESSADVYGIINKGIYLVAAVTMFLAVFFSRIGKTKSSLIIIPVILFLSGTALSLIDKFESYQNFYLNMEFLNMIFMSISAVMVIVTIYGAYDKNKSILFLYGIAGIAFFAGFIPQIISGDASAIVYAFRDYVPFALIYFAFGAYCHGLKKTSSEKNV